LAGLPFLNSCKDDPKPIAGISFDITDQETTESDGTTKSFNPFYGGTGHDISVKIVLDKAAPDNIVISYTVAGTAARTTTSSVLNDFNLDGVNAGESKTLIIEKGANEAVVTINVFEDNTFEVDKDKNLFETVILTLDKVVSGPASISQTNNVYTLKIYEDDALVFLQWDATPETSSFDKGDVDMDIFAFLNGDLANYGAEKDNEYEYLIIPAGYPDGSYGISCPYYSGTSNNLKFGTYIFGYSINNKAYLYGTDNPLIYSGTYTQANLNHYDLTAEVPATKIIQTFVKSKINFTTSAIQVPATGSRIGSTFGNGNNGVTPVLNLNAMLQKQSEKAGLMLKFKK
jgi:hypothetical protein